MAAIVESASVTGFVRSRGPRAVVAVRPSAFYKLPFDGHFTALCGAAIVQAPNLLIAGKYIKRDANKLDDVRESVAGSVGGRRMKRARSLSTACALAGVVAGGRWWPLVATLGVVHSSHWTQDICRTNTVLLLFNLFKLTTNIY